jgi:hypothetical protein
MDNSYAVRIASFNAHRSPLQSSFPYARSTKQVPKHRLKPNQLTPLLPIQKTLPQPRILACAGDGDEPHSRFGVTLAHLFMPNANHHSASKDGAGEFL